VKQYVFTIIIVLITLTSNAQIGGDRIYRFLDLPNSARQAALGGNQIAVFDDDPDMIYHNPSLLNELMHNHLAFNYVNYLSDIMYGYAAYCRTYNNAGTFALGIHYVDYGDFPYVPEEATAPIGTFTAKEYSFNISYSRLINSNFNAGATLKPVFSSLETYKSFGLLLDLGATYISNNKNLTTSLLFKNIGGQITTYYEGAEREDVPFDIQLGLTYKLKHAPIRLLATAQHLTDWNIRYEKQSTDELTQESSSGNLIDKAFNHFTVGAELFPIRNFTIRLGYNHLRKKELSLEDMPSTVGLSWGFGFKISKFNLSYGSAKYHLAGASNHFSISVNLSEFSSMSRR